MSKVLIITNHSYMLYRFRLELIKALLEKGHGVVLGMPFVGREEDFSEMGIRCIEIPVDRRGTNPKKDFSLFLKYRKLIKREKPDMVITYSIKPNIYAGLACSFEKVPFCANVQGLGTAFQSKKLAGFVTLLYKAAFWKVKTVFFENEGDAKEFCERKIVPAEKQKVLFGAGINTEKYALEPYPENEKTRFLYLGRIMREKGMDELFSSAEKLFAEGGDFILDLVGFFEDEYKEKAEELEKKGIVKFHGFREEPVPFYKAADCIVLPSYHEGMSNVLLEAASIGRPVITSRINGCMEAVIEGKSGFLCEAGNPKSLYDSMKKFLELPKEKRAAMGLCGRKLMEEKFEKKAVVDETIKALGL